MLTNSRAQVVLSEAIEHTPVWVLGSVFQEVELLQGLLLSLQCPQDTVRM